MKGPQRDRIATSVVDVVADTLQQSLEPIARRERGADARGVIGDDAVDECRDERAFDSEIMCGQSTTVAGRLSRLMEGELIEATFGDNAFGRFENAALGGFPAHRLGEARALEGLDRRRFCRGFSDRHTASDKLVCQQASILTRRHVLSQCRNVAMSLAR